MIIFHCIILLRESSIVDAMIVYIVIVYEPTELQIVQVVPQESGREAAIE